jgi:hypothetical protein
VVGVGEPYRSDLGKGLQAHVAALLGPLLGLLDEQRADEADDGSSVREDAHHIRAPLDLLVQALLRVGTPDLAPELLREVPEGQQVLTGLLEVLGSLRQLPGQRLGDPLELKL